MKLIHSQNIESQPKAKEFRRPILDILADLEKPVPARFIKVKVLKGNKIPFIPWHSLVRLLDYYAPGFDWEVIAHCDGNRVCVEGKLTIKAAEGDFSRAALGNEHSEVDSYGDPYSNAEAQAFRRACGKFKLGLHLWEKP
ncbi:MAG: hypothetical protein NVS2B14_00120 [Chamaesiphon sp.]